MRQVAILCVAALVALQENLGKLQSDHNKAKLLAGLILHGHIDFTSDPWPSISNSAKDLVKMSRADPKQRLSY
ncbi:hypothetical protein JHK82_052994 [Glycine max]|nr:hypothetical protein JHK86_052836 [Glycine max]KAG4927209.1 hypothetical protein JHK85_053695 [Glycine max]KAG5082829.1 hypothetical protein JHK84_052867 [Glycine max]KAG5085597.1 hypothetical protein JHK82_052994 [Glycine max]